LNIDGADGLAVLTGGVNGLDVAPRGATDRIHIRYREFGFGASAQPALSAEQWLHGNQFGLVNNFDPRRREIRNDTTLKLMDDFLGDVLAAQWNGRVGTDPQCVTPTILVGGAAGDTLGGAVRLVTGDDAAATMAVNGVQLDTGALNWGSYFPGLSCEFRVRLSAITNVAVFIGFTDQIAALEMPFTLAAGDALISNASNACGILFDTAADTDQWCLVGVAADVDAAKQFSGSAPVAATYETWRVEFSATGATNASASFYRNGVLVGVVMANAIVGNTDLTPVVAAFSRGAASRNIDVDYVHVQCNRV
jgi:hypothetical protein